MKTKTLTIIGALVVISVAIWIYVSSLTAKPTTFVLSNGTSVTFIGTTFGTNHFLAEGSAIKRSFASISHRLFPRWNWHHGFETFSQEPRLALWFKLTGAGISSPDIRLENFHGILASSVPSWADFVGPPGTTISAYEFDCFPRNESRFRAVIFDKNAEAAGFVVANPIHESYPKWTAEPLPQMKAEGEIAVTLKRVVANTELGESETRALMNRANPAMSLELLVTENGQLTRDWTIVAVGQNDATGNHHTSAPRLLQGKGEHRDNWIASTPSHLWPQDAPWKVSVDIVHSDNYGADEILSLTNIPVQTNAPLAPRFSRAGKYEIPFQDTNYVRVIHFAEHTFMVQIVAVIPPESQFRGYILYLKSDPPLGMHHVSSIGKTSNDDSPLQIQEQWPTAEADVQCLKYRSRKVLPTINLKLAIRRSHTFEFLVKPEVLESSVSKLAGNQ